MYCSGCGEIVKDDAAFCSRCGKAISKTTAEEEHPPKGPVGFSAKINDPAFKKYKKNSVAWSVIFATVLAVIAVIGFPIYGNVSGEIERPQSIYYGLGIGGMFIAIALLQTLKRGLDNTWDGTVIDKDSYRRKERDNDGYAQYHTIYILKIRRDSGGTKKHKWRDTPGLYNYYNVGDKVRHHKGFSYYEKYDKSADTQIMCAACMSFQDISKDVCPRCKCPLLK